MIKNWTKDFIPVTKLQPKLHKWILSGTYRSLRTITLCLVKMTKSLKSSNCFFPLLRFRWDWSLKWWIFRVVTNSLMHVNRVNKVKWNLISNNKLVMAAFGCLNSWILRVKNQRSAPIHPSYKLSPYRAPLINKIPIHLHLWSPNCIQVASKAITVVTVKIANIAPHPLSRIISIKVNLIYSHYPNSPQKNY